LKLETEYRRSQMKLYAPLFVALLAAPAFAQTEAVDPAELSTRSGSVFYSDDGMMTLRTAEEVKTRWAELPAEDQDALRAQCANLPTEGANTVEDTAPADTTSEPAEQPTEGANAVEDTAPADTTSEPAEQPTEGAGTVEDTAPANVNFVSDPVRMKAVCDMIASF
jgi:hypothetical protein